VDARVSGTTGRFAAVASRGNGMKHANVKTAAAKSLKNSIRLAGEPCDRVKTGSK